ncbi:MAG: hypothetical protein QXQ13_02840 [Thermoplasmata archaeon]
MDDDGELIDRAHCGYIDGTVIATLTEGGESGGALWLVETVESMSLRRDELRRKIGSSVRRIILKVSRDEVCLDYIFEGYWIPVALFGIAEDRAVVGGGPLDLATDSFIFLQTEMTYVVPSGPDPYLGRWRKGRLCRAKKIAPRRYGSQLLHNVSEVKIRLDNDRELVGFTNDPVLVERRMSSVLQVGLSIVNCTQLSKSSETLKPSFKMIVPESYVYEVQGVVTGLWWPDSGWYSIEVGDLIVVAQDTLGILESGKSLRMRDCVKVVGELQISQKSPYDEKAHEWKNVQAVCKTGVGRNDLHSML